MCTSTTIGSITATGRYNAGVVLASKYYTELVNDGTITADFAVLTGASQDEIWNYGTINGAIEPGQQRLSLQRRRRRVERDRGLVLR